MLFLFLFAQYSLIIFGHQQLEGRFKKQLARNIKHNSNTMMAQSMRHLIELGDAVLLSSSSYDEGRLSKEKLEEYLANNWELLQIDWGIETLGVYSHNGTRILQQGYTNGEQKPPHIVTNVIESQAPETTVFCGNECQIYAALPVVLSNNEKGILIISKTLVDYLVDFSRHNLLNAALLSPSENKQENNHLHSWGLKVTAITHGEKYLPILNDISLDTDVESFLLNGITIKQEQKSEKDNEQGNEKYYYSYAISLARNATQNQNLIVLISDVTSQIDGIHSFLNKSIFIAAIGSIASICILLFLLWRPMERIKRQAKILPLMAKSHFEEARKQSVPYRRSGVLYDELDVLEDTSVSLSHQLEKLQIAAHHHANKLEQMALYDGLTGLANRRLYTDCLNQIIGECAERNTQFALVFIDLDNFKRINDELGHDAGDTLLTEVAQRLTNNTRDCDVVARLGGDEFTLLLPQVKEKNHITDTVERILVAFNIPFTLNGTDVKVTPSIGISLGPDNGIDASQLMRCADLAMYQAKQAGKNSYRYYTDDMQS